MSLLKLFLFLKLTNFTQTRDAFFDVTADDAIELVLADPRKESESREEDAEFIRRLRRNEFVAFGARDWAQQQRFDRSTARTEEQESRREKELKRKRVIDKH